MAGLVYTQSVSDVSEEKELYTNAVIVSTRTVSTNFKDEKKAKTGEEGEPPCLLS